MTSYLRVQRALEFCHVMILLLVNVFVGPTDLETVDRDDHLNNLTLPAKNSTMYKPQNKSTTTDMALLREHEAIFMPVTDPK